MAIRSGKMDDGNLSVILPLHLVSKEGRTREAEVFSSQRGWGFSLIAILHELKGA